MSGLFTPTNGSHLLRLFEILTKLYAPLLGHRHRLLKFEIEGDHHRTALREAPIARHNTLVQSHTLVAHARHTGDYNDIVRKTHLT